MNTCAICYDDFKELELIKAGCCSMTICRDCIKDLKCCPQCKRDYAWLSDHKYVEKMLYSIQTENLQLKINNEHYKNDCITYEKLIRRYKKMLGQSNTDQILLMLRVESLENTIVEHIKEQQNTKELERVVKQYHLNLI